MLRCALMSARRARRRRTARASGHKKGSRSMALTPEQVRDLAQMSPAMWDMLRSVKLYRGGYSRPPETAEMLARRGFIEMTKPRPDADGFYSARGGDRGDHALRPPGGVTSGPAKKEPRSGRGLELGDSSYSSLVSGWRVHSMTV